MFPIPFSGKRVPGIGQHKNSGDTILISAMLVWPKLPVAQPPAKSEAKRRDNPEFPVCVSFLGMGKGRELNIVSPDSRTGCKRSVLTALPELG